MADLSISTVATSLPLAVIKKILLDQEVIMEAILLVLVVVKMVGLIQVTYISMEAL